MIGVIIFHQDSGKYNQSNYANQAIGVKTIILL